MQIGQLFIALGFKVTGRQDFDDAEKGMKRAAIDATKLTVAVNAVNAAVLALMASGLKAAVGLKNFRAATGGSTEELQAWEKRAAVADVSVSELTATIKELQDVRTSFALGEPKDVGVWSLLGVDPRQDPFKVLEQLRERFKGMNDVGLARGLAQRAGIGEGMFRLLRGPDDQFSAFRRQFEITRRQEDELIRLNRAWRELLFNLGAVRVQLAAALAPAFEKLNVVLTWLSVKIAAFTGWLSQDTTLAKTFRVLLGGLAVAMLLLGAAIAAAAAALAALSAGMFLLTPGLLAVAAAAAPVVAVLALMAAALAGMILLVDDFWTAIDGGKSLFDWNDGLLLTVKNVERLAKAMEWIRDVAKEVFKDFKISPEWMKANAQFFRDVANSPFGKGVGSYLNLVTDPTQLVPYGLLKNAMGGATVNQNINVDVAVDGSGSPQATAREIGRSFQSEIGTAARNLPVPNR